MGNTVYVLHIRPRIRRLWSKKSFSRTGQPYNNAVAEAFFSILKKEELYRRHYSSEADLIRGIHRFIDFYNNERPHSSIQYKTPDHKEQEYWKKKDSLKK
ncbi:MAG: integrase core domain-containing protein [Candidatus Pararuminococcus gallinarum]